MVALVSIIMPAYNAGFFLKDSINSVLSQTFTNWELIIVDDGSTDDTKIVVDFFCTMDSRIKYFYQDNGRQGKARNLALSKSKGSFIAFLDADDLWLPEKLELQLKQIEEKQVDLVFSDCLIFNTTISDAIMTIGSGRGFFKGEIALHTFLEKNQIPTLTVLVKADLIHNNQGFTEKEAIQNAEDYHLWLRLLFNGSTFFGSNLVLAAYREHALASTSNDKLSISKVIEALMDLKENFQLQKTIITKYLKIWFRRFHYLSDNWDLEKYRKLIKKNCRYTDSAYYNFFFQIILSLFGFRITRKLINTIVNQQKLYYIFL